VLSGAASLKSTSHAHGHAPNAIEEPAAPSSAGCSSILHAPTKPACHSHVVSVELSNRTGRRSAGGLSIPVQRGVPVDKRYRWHLNKNATQIPANCGGSHVCELIGGGLVVLLGRREACHHSRSDTAYMSCVTTVRERAVQVRAATCRRTQEAIALGGRGLGARERLRAGNLRLPHERPARTKKFHASTHHRGMRES